MPKAGAKTIWEAWEGPNSVSGGIGSLNHYSKTIDALPWSADRKMKELYYILIQAALFDENGATIPDLENHLQCSYGTLNKYIKRINEAGMLAEKKVGKNKYYSIQLETLDKYIE